MLARIVVISNVPSIRITPSSESMTCSFVIDVYKRQGYAFLLHLTGGYAHVDSGYLVNSSLGVAAVVDTLCASGLFKIAV